MTQKRLAKIIHVSQQAIQKIEDGQTKIPRKLTMLAEILDVNSEWLLTGSEEHLPKWLTTNQGQMRETYNGVGLGAHAVSEPTAFDYLNNKVSPRSLTKIKAIEQKAADGLLTDEDMEILEQMAERLAAKERQSGKHDDD